MSNYLAIATVTAALVQILQPAAGAAVSGATVTNVRPDSTGSGTPGARVNIYLYQVTPNTAWRNADLPTRDSNGQLAQRPRVALDLHYLLTFYGDETQLEPQRMLGSVSLALHQQPVLTRQMIRNTIASPTFPFLAASNLADDVELVKFTPTTLSLEELSKLWAVFFQVQYALSVTYQGTVVLIESDESPQPALPVLARDIYVVPFRHPTIEQINSQAGDNQPILATSTLNILGKQLRGDVTQVRVAGGAPVTPQDVSDTQIVLPLASLPANSLRAGVQGAQVIQPMLMGKPPVPHVGIESNVAAFVLRPTITAATVPDSTHVTVQTDLVIGKDQRVLLMLNRVAGGAPAAFSFVAGSRTADANSITVAIVGVAAGDYLVRVQIDGAESLLQVDTNPTSPTFNQFIGPKVTIP
jgi:hypothetical protein